MNLKALKVAVLRVLLIMAIGVPLVILLNVLAVIFGDVFGFV